MRLSRVDFSPLIHHTLVALLNGSSLSDWLAHCKDRAPSPLREAGWSLQACLNLARNDRCSRCRVSPGATSTEAAKKRYIQAVPAPMLELFIRHGPSQLIPRSSLCSNLFCHRLCHLRRFPRRT